MCVIISAQIMKDGSLGFRIIDIRIVFMNRGRTRLLSHLFLLLLKKLVKFMSIYNIYCVQTKLGSISLKPKTCEDIYLSPPHPPPTPPPEQSEVCILILTSYSTLINAIIWKKNYSRGNKNKTESNFARPLSLNITDNSQVEEWDRAHVII